MTPRGLTQPGLQEDTERELVEYSADLVRVIAEGAELGRKQGRADMLSMIIRHVNEKLNDADGVRGMQLEWRNGYRAALHGVGTWLAVLAAEETS